MHKKDHFIIWSMGLYFAWILPFPYFGNVLKAVLPNANLSSTVLTLAFLLFHALGYLFGGLFLKKSFSWNYLMFGSLIAVIIINLALPFTPAYYWPAIFAALGLVSPFYVLGWSTLLRFYPTARKRQLIAWFVIIANIFCILISFIISFASVVLIYLLIMLPLIAALLVLIINHQIVANQLPKEKREGKPPVRLVSAATLIIALLFVTCGFMYSVIHSSYPSTTSGQFAQYFKYIPYLVTFYLAAWFAHILKERYIAFLGISFLGLAFISFISLADSQIGFYLTTIAFEAAFALISVFTWVLLSNFGDHYGNIYRFFGFGLFANIFGTFVGGAFGDHMLSFSESPELFTALYALAAIFATILVIPWLIEQAGYIPAVGVRQALISSVLSDSGNLETISRQAGLTAREAEVLEQLIQGRSHKAIAENLCVSLNTLKTHLRNIYRKMNVRNKGELMAVIYECSIPTNTEQC